MVAVIGLPAALANSKEMSENPVQRTRARSTALPRRVGFITIIHGRPWEEKVTRPPNEAVVASNELEAVGGPSCPAPSSIAAIHRPPSVRPDGVPSDEI